MTPIFSCIGRRIVAACALAVIAAASPLSAQAGPPLARVVRDSNPALRPPVSPSAPPSSVAPRPGAQAAVRAQEAVVVPPNVAPVSAPVESVRPAVVRAPAATPMPVTAAPPAPAVQSASPAPAARAELRSDEPPAGATARCKDGSYLTGPLPAEPCADRGGLAVRFHKTPALRPPGR